MFRIWELPEITLGGGGKRCRTALEDVGRVLASTRVSPLSVAKIYNIFRGLSRGFVRFYVFDKGEPITSGKTHKDGAAPPGFFLVLSGGSWYDRPVELGTSPEQMEEAF